MSLRTGACFHPQVSGGCLDADSEPALVAIDRLFSTYSGLQSKCSVEDQFLARWT